MEISAPIRVVVELEQLKENLNPVYHPRWELAKVLLSGNLEVVCALEKAVQSTDWDTISGPLVTLFRMYNKAHKLLKTFIGKEIDATTEVGTLFRGISLTTKLVSAFCMQEGQAYCKNILDPCMKMFCIDEVSIEVDPNKLNPGEDLTANQQKLLGLCKGLLNHITRSVEQCSYALRKMFSQTQELVMKKFPEHNLRVVGGFYFLRFLCPALVCPEGFRLIAAPPAAKSRRSLILVSKILQNLANDVEFGEKESYMVSVNSFIKSNQGTMETFLDQLSHPSKPNAHSFLEIKQDPLQPIHQCIVTHKEKIGAILQKGGHGAIYDQLCEALDLYSSGSVKQSRRLSFIQPSNSPPTNRRRSSSAAPAVSSPVPISSLSPLSPTSTRISELVPISSSPSHSLVNLLELNIQPSSVQVSELAAKLRNLQKTEEDGETKETGNRSPSPEPLGSTSNDNNGPTPQLSLKINNNHKKELEEELKKEMQEIQALKVALESGAMGTKERAETHTRFAALLSHLKVLLADFKQYNNNNNCNKDNSCGGEEELELSSLVS